MEKFLSEREGSIDRFDVTDYRSQEEQDQESAISGRLKGLYKTIKKKAKESKLKAASEPDIVHEAGGEEEPIEPVNSQESLNLSILSEDGSDTVARKMEARNAIPPLDIELNEAFSHYFTESAGVLKIQDLSGALVQVLNVFVPPHIVEAALLKIAPHYCRSP